MSSAASSPDVKFGVDTGGTFTDVVARQEDGSIRVHKLLSTPLDPSAAIAAGVLHIHPSGEAEVVHGTTVATNAVLERRGAKVVLVTTAGFEDLLALGRQARPFLYALEPVVPAPLVPRSSCVGVRERVAFDGLVVTELEADTIESVVERVASLEPEAVAVCFLHAYANADHEVMLGRALREALAEVHVTLSSELVPEIREFERASTTALNAYVGPVMSRYFSSLRERLPDASLEILQSSGGRATLDEAAAVPVQTVLSGPAGGVVGALSAARDEGIDQIVTFDMGGTSTDVCLCRGTPPMRYGGAMGDIPLLLPVIDIHTVGAGGGSIARRDLGGALRVGPRSAGASPGPACYGEGGADPTVTDAHVALGHIPAHRFLGGEMLLDVQAASEVVARLAAELGLETDECARGILDVADAAMVRAIKVVSIEKGHDPRDFTLVAFGGAGGLHACRVAGALGMRTVLVPANPGLLSAWGMLHAPRLRFYAQTVVCSPDHPRIEEAREDLARRAAADFDGPWEADFRYDMRYLGQSFEVTVAHPGREAFEAAHQNLYGTVDPERAIEVVTLRLRASMPSVRKAPATVSTASEGRLVVGPSERSELRPGDRIVGPATLFEYSGTTLVPDGWEGRVTSHGHLLLEAVP